MAASTGSPASRRSTKLTPLTTRPSLTSRQGITRTLNIRLSLFLSEHDLVRKPVPAFRDHALGRGTGALDQRQRGCGIEPPVIKRTAGDDAGQLIRPRRQHRLDVLDRGETAGGDDGNGDALRQRNRRVDIEALEQAIAGDIGEDDGA